MRAAVLEMVRKEREGEQIDRKLIKQVVEIFVEMGSSRTGLEVRAAAARLRPHGAHRPRASLPRASPPRSSSSRPLQVYVTDFEEQLLTTTADFYSRESAKWAEEDSFPDYMVKAEALTNPGPTRTSSTSSTSSTHPPPSTHR